jgi:alpha-tubulin suppressor-like RCC1 family protein
MRCCLVVSSYEDGVQEMRKLSLPLKMLQFFHHPPRPDIVLEPTLGTLTNLCKYSYVALTIKRHVVIDLMRFILVSTSPMILVPGLRFFGAWVTSNGMLRAEKDKDREREREREREKVQEKGERRLSAERSGEEFLFADDLVSLLGHDISKVRCQVADVLNGIFAQDEQLLFCMFDNHEFPLLVLTMLRHSYVEAIHAMCIINRGACYRKYRTVFQRLRILDLLDGYMRCDVKEVRFLATDVYCKLVIDPSIALAEAENGAFYRLTEWLDASGNAAGGNTSPLPSLGSSTLSESSHNNHSGNSSNSNNNHSSNCNSVIVGDTGYRQQLQRTFRLLHSQASGNVIQWGLKSHRSLEISLPLILPVTAQLYITEVAAAAFHTLLLTSGGKVMSWGSGCYGKLGHGNLMDVAEPQAIEGLSHEWICRIAVHDRHSSAVTRDGRLYQWGCGAGRRLGTYFSTDQLVPVEFSLPFAVRTVACTFEQTILLSMDGVLWHVVAEDVVPLPSSSSSFSPSPNKSSHDSPEFLVCFKRIMPPAEGDALPADGFQDVRAGVAHCLALSFGGEIYGWGQNQQGACGIGSDLSVSLYPRRVDFPGRAHRIVCGPHHSMALGEDGQFFVWGLNDRGQCGPGVAPIQHAPHRLSLPGNGTSPVLDFTAGQKNTFILLKNRELWGLGGSAYGRLGFEAETAHSMHQLASSAPLRISLSDNNAAVVLRVFGGHDSFFAITRYLAPPNTKHCLQCKDAFTVLRKRHLCRICAGYFDNKCSSSKIVSPDHSSNLRLVRVCDQCLQLLNEHVQERKQATLEHVVASNI